MHVGIFTYNIGHRKTFDVLRLMMYRHTKITLFAFPFSYSPSVSRTQRWQERPWGLLDFDPRSFYKNQGIEYVELDGWSEGCEAKLGKIGDASTPDIYLTCIGAKLIPRHFIDGRTVLNCHPALLPQNRGLDAFKWGILNKWPFGASLFIMDEVLDRGQLLFRTRIPVIEIDTLDDVAMRTYEMECRLTAEFDRFIENREFGWHLRDSDGPLSEKLIPKSEDNQIHSTFEKSKAHFIEIATDINKFQHPSDVYGDGLRLIKSGGVLR